MSNQDLISAYEFAERKGINVTNIYRLINSGNIDTIQVGKTKYINWFDYSHLDFPKSTGKRISKTELK